VNELDGTGAAVLAQTARRLRADGRRLLLSHLEDNVVAVGAVRDAGLSLTPETVFADTDAALEWTEDSLIAMEQGLAAAATELALGDIPVLSGLSETDTALIAHHLRRVDYRAGDVVIRQGDIDRSLFIVARGTTTVRVKRIISSPTSTGRPAEASVSHAAAVSRTAMAMVLASCAMRWR